MAWSGSPTATRLPPPPGEQVEQLDLGGVGVLVLVDEQPAGPLALLAQQLGVAVELGDGLAHQLGRVVAGGVTAGRRRERRDLLVLLLEGGGVHPVLAPGLPAPGGQLRRSRRRARWPAAAARAARCGSPRCRAPAPGPPASGRRPPPPRRPRSSSATTASCSAEVSSRGGASPAQQGGPAEHAVGVGVEGAGQRLADGAARRGAVMRVRSSAAALRLKVRTRICSGSTPGLDAGGDRLDDRRRLAGAGPGEHEQRTGRVVDDGLLGGVEPRSRRRRGSPATSR